MAAESVTLEEAAAAFGSSVATIERMAQKLGLPLKGREGHAKSLSAGAADVGLKAKGK
jgi:predicted DNA-binding transcriptional regulator YafY